MLLKRQKKSKDAFQFFSSRFSYIILTHAVATHDKHRGGFRGRETACRDVAYPHAKFQFPVRRDRCEASRARWRETPRRKTRAIVRWYFSFVNGLPSPPVAIPPPLRNFAPEGDRSIHWLVLPFIHEYEIIGNQRYTGHSWRHNEPRSFVNECTLVYARAITTCPRGGSL